MPAPAGTGRPAGNGSASLFTPAYRVRHADAPSSPADDGFRLASPRAGDADYGLSGTGQQGTGYRWSEIDQPSASYRQADYGASTPISAWADDLQGSGYSWLTDDHGAESRWPASSGGAPKIANAIRGFPPIPDEPLPAYPPGPFAAWNRGGPDPGDGRAATAKAATDLLEPPGASTRMGPREEQVRMLATITPDEFDTNHSLPAIKDPVLTKGRGASADRGSAVASRSAARASAAKSPPDAPARGRVQADRDGRSRSRDSRSRNSRSRDSRSRDRGRSKRTSKGSKRQPVRLAIGVAVVIIAAVAAILVITSLGKPGTSAGNTPNRPRASASPTPTTPGGKWGFIGARRTDPVPLTLSELFPFNFATGGVFYHASATKAGHNCHAALVGTALQTAVRQAQCSQVLRASYVARAAKAMATIGVFNLATSSAASAAARHAGPAEFVAVLPGKIGLTSSIGQGSGIEEAVVKGHYLVLVWAENTNLAASVTNWQRQHLTGFVSTLLQQTVNRSLSYRMVDGRPTPGQGG